VKLDRRTLLIGGGVGVGLVVGFALWPRRLKSALSAGSNEQAFGNFIKIARDGRITIAVPQVETGQGIWTALPQIAADELGAAWETIGVEPAPLVAAYANPLAKDEGWLDGFGALRAHRLAGRMRITAESTSVRAYEQPLREAAAVARTMLVGAAADRWNVDPRDCETADGFVINGGRTFTFGELAEEAAERSPPRHPPLRQTTKERLTGLPLQRLDGPAKAEGRLRFAGDVRLPGLLYAAARLAPPDGRLTRFPRETIEALPGIRHVAAREGWIAVVAESWWTAERALKLADPTFSGARTPRDPRPIFERALASGDAQRWFSRGDYEGVVRGSRPLAATYYVAPSLHLGLEPVTATAQVSSDALEVWAPSLAPDLARDSIGGANVSFYPMPVGEPAGRAMEADAMPIAVELARIVGRPVQVNLSHAASQNHDRVAPGALARMTALPGEGGITAAWAMRVATVDGLGSALSRLAGGDVPDQIGRTGLDGAIPPYGIPNVRVEAVPAPLPFAVGYMRGSPQREMAFFTESFLDELAHAAGMEPLAFRMSLLGENGRLARCLQGAARLAQWDGGGPGSTMGIAACSAYGSHIALVATASIGDDQRVKVHRLVAAVDCGRVVNSGLVAQQIESGLIWGLAQASVPEPEWVTGMPIARPMGAIRLPRIAGVPEIFVEQIPSSEPAGGIGGLGLTVVAPAVANAIHAGSGKRMRALPFDPMAVA
jgi:isoquinoline 1-oxidoreductase subunit beta